MLSLIHITAVHCAKQHKLASDVSIIILHVVKCVGLWITVRLWITLLTIYTVSVLLVITDWLAVKPMKCLLHLLLEWVEVDGFENAWVFSVGAGGLPWYSSSSDLGKQTYMHRTGPSLIRLTTGTGIVPLSFRPVAGQ